MQRETEMIRAGLIGILVNFGLAAVKGIMGILSGSVAVIADAANNLSDMVSSALTLATAKAASGKPDSMHPFGHGRIEYLTSIVIGNIVLFTGIFSVKESVSKIFHPAELCYSPQMLLILTGIIGVKLILGAYFEKKGKEIKAETLRASGKDAWCDAFITAAVVLSAVLYMLTGVNQEAYVGSLISLIIIWNGLGIIGGAASMLLGPRADQEIYEQVQRVIREEPEVLNLSNLVLHDYGPERLVGSVNIQVQELLTAAEIAALEQKTMQHVASKCKVMLTSIGVYVSGESVWMNQGDDEPANRGLSAEK